MALLPQLSLLQRGCCHRGERGWAPKGALASRSSTHPAPEQPARDTELETHPSASEQGMRGKRILKIFNLSLIFC